MDAPDDDRPTPPQRTSRLARATMICGVLALLTTCVHGGVFGMATIFLGAVTLDRLRRSSPPLRGRKHAWIGISLAGVSVALGLLLAWAATLELKRSEGALDTAIRKTLALSDAGETQENAARALDDWTPQPGVTLRGEDLVQFARLVRERYGACERVAFESRRDDPRLDGTVHSQIDATFYFKSVKVPATVSAIRRFDLSAMTATLRIDSIVLRDGKRGDITVPMLAPNSTAAKVDTTQDTTQDTTPDTKSPPKPAP